MTIKTKSTPATKFIREAAARFAHSCEIEWDSAFSTVLITDGGDTEQGIFMQGEEAADFIEQIEALCRKYPSLDEYTAACALAEPIAECCFN